jgi:dihydroorotase
MKTRIINGQIIDPANGINAVGDLCVEGDKILSSQSTPDGFNADLEIDAEGKMVIPGMVDLCARFREPGQEFKATIASESMAAASAGITTVCYPPDTQPIIDTSSVVELIHQRTNNAGKTRIYPLGALTHGLGGDRLADMRTLMDAGCVGISNANRPIENTEVLRRAMEYAASFEITLFIQAEDNYLRNNGSVHEGEVSTRLGLPPIPVAAETVAVSRVLLLMELTGARVHFCRLTTAKSVEMITRAKADGLPVSADVGITHLHLTDEAIGSYDTNFHLIPPLRSEKDRVALTQAVIDGSIDSICSDHQPHDEDAKAAPFALSEPGGSTLEVLFPLVIDIVQNNKLSIEAAIASITHKPAEILGLDLGTLGIGRQADIAIIDSEKPWQVNKDSLVSAGKNSPFLGRELRGKVSHSLMAGKVVFEA